MRKNFTLIAIASLSFLCACEENLPVIHNGGRDGATLYATLEQPAETKTELQLDGSVLWEPSEEIMVFSGTKSGKFTSTNTEPSASATFTGDMSIGKGSEIWALYPYDEDATFSDGLITTTIPCDQVAVPGTFARNTNVTVAHSTDTNLQFYNVCGGVRFSVTEEGINKVIFEGLDGEAIAGKVKIGFENGIPVVQEVTDARLFITLTAPDGKAFETGKWYYIVALPGALEKGYKLRLYKNDSYAKRLSDKSVSIKRSVFGSIAEVDRGKEYEPVSLHFPKTKDEIIESVERTQRVSEEVNGMISDFLDADGAGSDELLSKIENVDDVLTAVINESHTTLSIMQRDSVWVNYYLFRDNPSLSMNHEKPALQPSQVRINKDRSARDRAKTKSAGDEKPVSSKKALILAPFATGSHSNYTDFNELYAFFQNAGIPKENIDCFKDRQVTLKHFRGDFLDDYDIIIIKTHGGIGYSARNSQGNIYENYYTTNLATSVPYTLEQVQSLYDAGQLRMDEIAIVNIGEGEDSELVMAVTPSFLEGASFDDACVILGACESAKIPDDSQFGYGTSMVEAFKRKGAGFVAGFSESVISRVDYAVTTVFLEFIADGISAQKAAEYWINSKELELYCSSLKNMRFKYHLLMQQPFNGQGYSPSLFSYFPSSGDYYFVDRRPILEEPIIGDDGITLSWSSDLSDITEEILEFGEIQSYDENRIIDYDYTIHTKEFKVHYDVYYDDLGCAGRRQDYFPDKSLVEKIPMLPPGEHKWYVEAFIMDGNTVIDSFKSEEKTFTISGPVPDNPDLSSSGTANCYIVSAAGDYQFKTVQGNTSTSVGSVASAEVLWETYGTSTKPSVGDLVNTVTYSNGYITFKATGKKGNALIAAKDASGNILWSWHIWCTDKPEDQVYKNNAGTMMDRNLGAISTIANESFCLLYQWGRKDPFLGGTSVFSSYSRQAASTITWPSSVSSNSSNGTIAFATSHPTTFIMNNSSNSNWNFYTDDTLWSSSKSAYDPCPPGYRVPDGGDNGIWSKAYGSSSYIENGPWDSTNKGMDFAHYFTSSAQCFYPATGFFNASDGSICLYGDEQTFYWSCTPNGSSAYNLYFNYYGAFCTSYSYDRSFGFPVRCSRDLSMSEINVSSVSLNKNSLTLAEGEAKALIATVSPSDATNKNVSWSSSNTSVATVSSSGKVTAVKAGSATITVTTEDGGKTDACYVTVNAATADPSKPRDLSSSDTANSYIVSSEGVYKFQTVKGNTSTSVGSVSSASVVWESFGTSTKPSVGDLVNTVSYSNGYITFKATGKKGNALIAANDASGNILWSWHIWCTDKPEDQVYNNGAGIMMDRNLGATSTTPGDVCSLGLLYQWGRKDPFLGSSSISSNTEAASTWTFRSPVLSDSWNGTIASATSNPTTFITGNNLNYDWCYTNNYSTDNTRWSSNKGTYDPCPPGYRVPDGGNDGIWSKALESASHFENGPWDSTDKGMDFNSYFTLSDRCWYPSSGFYNGNNGYFGNVGKNGEYWSCALNGIYAYSLSFSYGGNVYPTDYKYRSYGLSVRCCRE